MFIAESEDEKNEREEAYWCWSVNWTAKDIKFYKVHPHTVQANMLTLKIDLCMDVLQILAYCTKKAICFLILRQGCGVQWTLHLCSSPRLHCIWIDESNFTLML